MQEQSSLTTVHKFSRPKKLTFCIFPTFPLISCRSFDLGLGTRGFAIEGTQDPWPCHRRNSGPVALPSKELRTRGLAIKETREPWLCHQRNLGPVALPSKELGTHGIAIEGTRDPWPCHRRNSGHVALPSKEHLAAEL